MGMASLPKTTWRELSRFFCCFADLRSLFKSCIKSTTSDFFCWIFLVTFFAVFFLVLAVLDFLFTVVLDLFFAVVALAFGDVDSLLSVVLGFFAVVALVGFAVVIVLCVELFVLGGELCDLRCIFFWFELPLCASASFFELPSEVFTAS